MSRWKQFSGAWTPTQQLQARGANTWPAVPGAPTIGTATVVGTGAEVSFTAPANPGYPATLSYTVTSSPGGLTGTGSASPITITGFSAGVAYTFTVTATNDTGTGPASAASNSVTPLENKALYAIGGDNGGGNGAFGLNNTIYYSSPVQVGALVDWKSISASNVHVVAVKRDGTLWSWGSNNQGQLGQNNGTSYSSPVQVGALTNWSKTSAGKQATLATKTDGTLWAWGDNTSGVLGLNLSTAVNVSSPVQIGSATDWVEVAIGGDTAAGIRGTALYTWGQNGNGNLGQNLNPAIDRSSPVQVGSDSWAKVAVGMLENGTHVLAVRTNGELYAWGLRTNGRLGDNQTSSNKSSPVQIGALTNWSLVSAGKENSHAIKTDGTLWAWGNEALGTNNTISYSSPVQVGGLTDWATVDNKMDSGSMTTVATKTDFTMWAWGKNDAGQFGLNNVFAGTYSSPVQIGSGKDWLEAQVGNNFIVALEKP